MAVLAAVLLLAALLPVALPSNEPAGAATGAVNLLFTAPGSPARYGANQVVALEAGNINFVADCKQSSFRETAGIGDSFQPFADLYIVPAGSTFLNETKLVDAAGSQNTVAGGIAGSFLYEPLGATSPIGLIKAGRYGVVVDECQNGVFDFGEDSFVDDAFRVDVKTWVPQLNPEVSSFLAMKSAASKFSKTMDSIEKLLKLKELMELAEKVEGYATAVASPEAFTVFVINGAVGALAENSPYEVLKQRAQQLAQDTIAQHRGRMQRLAADPPQTNFTRFALPKAAGAYMEESTSVFGETSRAYVAQQDALSALEGSIVDAIERYQGAQAAGDPAWALRHARTAIALTQLYEQRMTAFGAASDAFEAATLAKASPSAFQFAESIRRMDEAYDNLESESLTTNERFRNSGADAGEALGIEQDYQATNGGPVLDAATTEWIPVLNQAQADTNAFAATLPDLRADLAGLADQIEASLGAEDTDPGLGITVTGSPVAGGTVALSATGLTGPASVTWDLDQDGTADDATGTSTPWTIPADAMTGVPLVVSATANGSGFQASASTMVTVVAGGNRPPTVTGSDQTLREIAPGGSTAFAVTATDPDGDGLTYEWLVDGVSQPGQTASTFTLTSAASDFGSRWVDVLVRDSHGALTRNGWFARIVTPDADGDLFRAAPGPDCVDVPDASGVLPKNINPAHAEVASNGADDDCDPGTLDDGSGSVGSISLQGLLPAGVGDVVQATAVNWTHPQRNTGIQFRLEVDWGDGSPLDTQTVSGTVSAQTGFALPSHRYRQARIPVTVGYCIEVVSTGYRFCGPSRVIAALNTRPVVNAADLRSFGPVERSEFQGQTTNGDWAPLDPDGRQTISVDNAGNTVVLPSNVDLPGGYGRAALTHHVVGISDNDNDYIGLLFGFQPGEANSPTADFVGVQWSNHDSTPIASADCNDEPSGSHVQPNPFTAWRQAGEAIYWERLGHTTLHFPYNPADDASADGGEPQDPRCDDDQGRAEIGFVPPVDDHDGTRTDTWRVWRHRATSFAELENTNFTEDPYLIEYDYQPDRLRVWVDGDLHLDVTPADPAKPFPPGQTAIAYQSQEHIRATTTAPEPTFHFVQGRGNELSSEPADGISMPMMDGIDDTHVARIAWGDGTPTTEGVVTADPATGWGWFDITSDHVYEAPGTFHGEVCATDQDDLGMCFPFTAIVDNAPPTVDAGPDRPTGPTVTLDDMTFQDPGRLDTHTATIDWGEGDAPEAATVTEDQGGGTVTGTHTFSADGLYVMELCVTDLADATTCDQRELDVHADNVAPAALAVEALTVPEGSEVEVPVGFNEVNVDDVHTVTVDWDDGSAVEPVTIQDAGDFGSGTSTHTYRDDGVHEVTFEVCDGDDACTTSSTTVTVTNKAPATVIGATAVDGLATLTGTYSDAGLDDTHTATVDWGDGGGVGALTLTPSPGGGGGTFSAQHTYTAADDYDLLVCVTDDDEGEGCNGAELTIESVTGAAPVVTAPEVAPTTEGALLSVVADFTDADAGGTHTATIDWGDGTTSPATIDEGAGTATGTHTYADDSGNPAVPATITVEVCDDTARCGTDTTTVTVTNATPVVDAGRDRSSPDEVVLDDSTFTDAGSGDTHTATVDWDDGAGPEAATLLDGTVQGAHTYATDGEREVTICVTDDDDGTGCDSFDLTIEPAPLTVTVASTFTVEEGTALSVPFTFADPGGGTHTVTFRGGDGSAPAAVTPSSDGTSGAGTGSHPYADNGTFGASVEVCGDNGCATGTTSVTVTNAAPVVAAPTGTAADAVLPITATFTDAGPADTHTATIDWGDGASSAGTVSAGQVTGSHTYAAADTYTVEVCVTDDDSGGDCADAELEVDEPPNVAPDLTLTTPTGLLEGTAFSLTGTLVDPDADTWTLTVDWGDGDDDTAPAAVGPVSIGHTYVDDGGYTIHATLSDGTDDDEVTIGVTVANVAPTVDVDIETEGLHADAAIDLEDAGTDDALSATIDWGDGTVESAAAAAARGSVATAEVTDAGHDYDTADTYALEICGSDTDGGRTCIQRSVTVAEVVTPTDPTDPPSSTPPTAPSDPGGPQVGGTDQTGDLPRTGGDPAPWVRFGVAILLAGAAALGASRARRHLA